MALSIAGAPTQAQSNFNSALGGGGGGGGNPVYAGPVLPSNNTSVFRATGQSVPNSNNTGQVLGVTYTPQTTGPVNTTPPQSTPSAFPSDQYKGWDPASAQADWNAKQKNGSASQSSGPSMNDLIDQMYSGTMDALNNAGSSAQNISGQIGDLINSTFTSGQNRIQGESTDLNNQLGQQQDQYNKQYQSAVSQATQYLNALRQQASQRFGGASGAGLAVNDLANQAYLQNQGNLQQQNLQGQQDFANQHQQLSQYISGKMDDLTNWQKQSNIQNQQQLAEELNQINLAKGQTESDKAQAKMQALQSTMQRAQTIQDNAMQFKQNLAGMAIQVGQQAAQRAWSPQEIASVYNGIMNQDLQNFGQQTASQPSGANPLTMAQPKSALDQLKQAGLI